MKNDIVCHKMRYDMNIVIYDKRYIMIWYMKHDDVIKWKYFPRYWPFYVWNSLVTGEFPAQRPVTRSFDVFVDLRLNKRLSK